MEAASQATIAPPVLVTAPPLRLDLGCGKRKKEGFTGVDVRAFDGVDVVCDLAKEKWPWADGSVDEANCEHVVEHLVPAERIHFVNELYRVLKKGGRCLVVTPHWASNRAYGDLTHQWPPVSEMWFAYLSAAWRETNAPHNDGYSCDFEAVYGYGINPALTVRSQEFQQHALGWFKEAAMDLVATLTKR